jgi:hypothetical protein
MFASEQRLRDLVVAVRAEHWGVIERRVNPVRGSFTLNHCTVAWMHPLLLPRARTTAPP